jgi:hypothetical protein
MSTIITLLTSLIIGVFGLFTNAKTIENNLYPEPDPRETIVGTDNVQDLKGIEIGTNLFDYVVKKDQGPDFGVTKATNIVFENQTDFDNFISKYKLEIKSAKPDFDKEIAIGVFVGIGIHESAEITSITENSEYVSVNSLEVIPMPNCNNHVVLTSPYSIIRMAKTTKPVKFHRIQYAKNCKAHN